MTYNYVIIPGVGNRAREPNPRTWTPPGKKSFPTPDNTH